MRRGDEGSPCHGIGGGRRIRNPLVKGRTWRAGGSPWATQEGLCSAAAGICARPVRFTGRFFTGHEGSSRARGASAAYLGDVPFGDRPVLEFGDAGERGLPSFSFG